MISLDCEKITNKDFTIGPLKYKFQQGHLYFLEGPNGAGKSTTLRYIYNTTLSDNQRKRTFYAADIYAGYLNISIAETIKIFELMYYKSFDIDKFHNYSDLLKVQNHKRVVKTLSSGEKIILMFCLLMACSPKIIIFDEALYPVDKERRKKILSLLKEYVKESEAIFIGTSHSEDINNYADITLTLEDGELKHDKKNN